MVLDDRAARAIADDPLAAFVPRLAAELGAGSVPSCTSVDGSMLSADISGFTALSEKLAGKGKAGAEEITDLVNRCFTALIDAAYDYGGEVLKFGGDALLVLFRGPNHARRAVDGGLAMQRALHASAAAKRANLTMTVGVSDGPFDVFLAGSGYRELLVTGPRASEVIRLEGEAQKGDTLVSPSVAAELPPEMHQREECGGVVVIGSTGDTPPGPAARDHGDLDLVPYVPPQVIEQLSAFAGLGGEHRLVTVGFLMVGGVAARLDALGADGTAHALHRLVDDVVEACAAFGVTVLHTDIAPDGVKFVLCAGAPVNPGDTSDAMLQAALRIAAIDSPFVLRQGVQTGRVFAGFLGSPYRRTYTLMGDPVNTAARMLGKADDREVVAVADVVADTRTVFVTEELEPFLVKGKTEPIAAHKVRATSDAVRRDTTSTRLVGRRRELELLAHSIGELGEVVVLSGQAGVGKSRLLDAAWDMAEGLHVFQAACTPYGAASPYSVFRPLLRMGTGIDVHADPALAGELLGRIVRRAAPDLLPWLPLLAVPFGAEVPPTPESDAIDPQFRRARIHDVVVEFLDTTLEGPVFLVVEDLHWIDDASGELLNHLIAAAGDRPWASVLTRRPHGTWTPPEDEHVWFLELEPLSDDDIRSLAIEVSERALSDADLDTVAARAGGNPLFAVELTRALDRRGGGELPDSIEGLIATRIDDLPPDQRRLLRVAAVFGREFDLGQVATVAGERLAVGNELADMVEPLQPSQFRFRHAMYRDVAYEGLPFRHRQRLHGDVAELLLDTAGDEAGTAALLSVHFAAAGRRRETWRYSLLAGRAAEASNAAAEAADAYRRALEASARVRDVDAVDRAEVAERLGDLCFALGRFGEAEHAFGAARRLALDPLRAVRLMRKLGSIRERQGRSGQAWRWYRRAAAAVPARARERGLLSERALIELAQAGLRHREGDNEQCALLARRALDAARAGGDEAAEALALERLHLATVYLRRPDDDRAGPQALVAHRRLGDRSGMVRTLINLGIEAYFAGDWTTASQHYLDAVEAGQEAGNVVLAATAAMNSAEILADQGHWDRAVELLDDAVRNFTAVGYPVGVAAATLFAAVAEMRRGHLDRAGEHLVDARTRLEGLGVAELLDDVLVRELELDLLHGTATVERCDAVLDQLGQHPFRARVLRARALARHGAGDPHAADDVETALASGPTGLERVLTLAAHGAIVGDATFDDEASRICAELGIVHLPPLAAGTPITART